MMDNKQTDSLPENSSALTLLAVLAHPDDESFGMGGTLALYAHRGFQVHLVCATRGEVGEVEEKYMQGYKTIGDLREAELCCAADKLGLTGVHFLGYRDSGMPGSPNNNHPQALAATPLEEVAARVVHYIRLLRPQVVVTFDPIGGYKHPDHIAVHRATVRAFELAGDENFSGDLPPFQPQKLYFHVFPKELMRLGVRVLPLFRLDPHKFGRNGDVDLVELLKEGDFPVHAQIDIHIVGEEKTEAAACHASQLDGTPQRGPMAWLSRWFGSREQFMRAYPPAPRRLHERDLFEGIRLDQPFPQTMINHEG